MFVFTKLKNLLSAPLNRTSKKCYFCKRVTFDMRNYKSENNKKIKVCHLCVEYAERRAFRK